MLGAEPLPCTGAPVLAPQIQEVDAPSTSEQAGSAPDLGPFAMPLANDMSPGIRRTGRVRRPGRPARNTASLDSVDLYLRDLEQTPMLDRHDEVALARRALAGDEEARARLVTGHLRFVVSFVKPYARRGVPMADLVNEGNLGLLEAAKRFNPDLGVRFLSYAVWYVRQAVLLLVAGNGRLVRVPGHRLEQARRASRRRAQMEQALQRTVTLGEVLTALEADGVAPEEDPDLFRSDDPDVGPNLEAATRDEGVARIAGRTTPPHALTELLEAEGRRASGVAAAARVSTMQSAMGDEQVISFDEPYAAGEGHTIGDLIADPDAETAAPGDSVECRATVDRALATLSAREQQVLRRYFGLDGDEPATLEDIAVQLGITRERVRQIRVRALAKLRGSPAGRQLAAFH